MRPGGRSAPPTLPRGLRRGGVAALIVFQPYGLFIALRYLRTRRRQRFATFVSLVSIAGIGLGVAALIIVLSVMNGFEREVTRHVLGMSAHAVLIPPGSVMRDWRRVLRASVAHGGVIAAAPYVRGSGMLSRKGEVRGVVVEGIAPTEEARVTRLAEYLDAGALQLLDAPGNLVLIGSDLAREMDVAPGDTLTLVVPDWDASGQPRAPRYAALEVGGVFHVGMYQYDSRLVLMGLAAAQQLFGLDHAVSGIRLRFAEAELAPVAVRQLVRALGEDLHVIDWTQYHRNFFLALKSQKRIMFIILVLIIAVAAFNIAANMVMVVTEKIRDIAILRTLGASRARIVALFLTQGLLIGVAGAVLGASLGAWGAHESEAMARVIESVLEIDLINADVYFIDYLPAELHAVDIAQVMLASVALSLLATIYPAFRAASVNPAEAVHRD